MILYPSGDKPAYRLQYDSNYSGITDREITIIAPFDLEDDQYLEAYCFLRGGKRTFQSERIISLTNISTGETFNNRDFKFQFKPVSVIIKKTISATGNVYYYEKIGVVSKHYKPTWVKIGMQTYHNYLFEHANDFIKREYNNHNEVCYLEWNEKQHRQRKLESNENELSVKEPVDIETFISLKAMKSENNTEYYYEKFGDSGFWTRIGKVDFEYKVAQNKDYALDIKYDSSSSVVFIRYKLDNNHTWGKWGLKPVSKTSYDKDGNIDVTLSFEKIPPQEKSGCGFILLFIVSFTIIIYLI
jgi:hypothetical protein